MRAIVIGSGVVGLCAAHALAERGVETLVLDRRAGAAGASIANAGLVTPSLAEPLPSPASLRTVLRGALDPGGPLAIGPRALREPAWLARFLAACRPQRREAGLAALQALAADAVASLEALPGAGDGAAIGAGLLHAGGGERELRDLEHHFAALAALGGTGAERLDGAALAALEPALAPGAGGFLAPGDRYLDPGRLCASLRDAALGRGVRFERFAATRILPAGARPAWSVEGPAGERRADAVILAAGPSGRSLLRPLGVDLPLLPARGFSLTFPEHEPRLGHALHLPGPRVTVTPLGRRLRLSTFFGLGMDGAELPRRRIGRLLRVAASRLPGLRLAGRPTALAGERAVLPDGLPAIGPLPGHPGLFVASGHSTLGLTLAAPGAELLAAAVVGEPPDPRLGPLDPGRFGRTGGGGRA